MGDEPARGVLLEAVGARARGCVRCPALVATRRHVVVGTGAAAADVAVVAAAPDAHEDALGAPLVGRAGALLERLLERAGVVRDDVRTTLLVRCRPPGNRDPAPAEVAACDDYLSAELELVQPVVVVALGSAATKLLRADPAPIRERRGREEGRLLGGRPAWLLPVFHPAAALYAPALVDQLAADLARLPELLARGRPELARAPDPALVEPPAAEAVPGQLELF